MALLSPRSALLDVLRLVDGSIYRVTVNPKQKT
jgi:hypothetical protein